MVTDADKPREHGPVLSDADRLLLLVRRMHAIEFASVFRQELGASELMQVITAVPTGRLKGLLDRAGACVVGASARWGAGVPRFGGRS
jgi:hypothetical protein